MSQTQDTQGGGSSPDPFRGRVAVVTGGGSGIGAGMAKAFAARGARVVLADIDEAAMGRTAGEIAVATAGAQVHCERTDVTRLESLRSLADATFARFGGAHVVCNNAGVAVFGDLLNATHRDWEYVMGVDFWGVVHGVETFYPRLVDQGQGGHFVNTASMAGLVGMQYLGVYNAAKFAVVGLTESLAREARVHGIGVSVLCPMIVDTPINRNSLLKRPAELRNPGDEAVVLADPEAGEPTEEISGAMKGGVVTVDDVVRRVVRGIERNDLYILTHPEQREFLRRRAERLDRMFEPGTW